MGYIFNPCSIFPPQQEFKLKAHLARHCATAHGLVIRAGSPRPIMKTRAAFYLHTTSLTRKARRYASNHVRPRHAARNPFQPINVLAIKQECMSAKIQRGRLVVERFLNSSLFAVVEPVALPPEPPKPLPPVLPDNKVVDKVV